MLCARHAPRHRAPQPPGRRFGGATREVAIVGAGLAGAAVARALAALGVRCNVFEAQPAIAQGGSGQPAGLLHGVLHADDSPHTRWFRAAALRAHATIAPLIAQQRVRGRLDGLLRVEHALDHASMLDLLRAQGLPPDYVQALSVDEASERAGCALAHPAWLYAGGGWVEPVGLVRAWLDHAAIDVGLNTAVASHRIRCARSVGACSMSSGRALAECDQRRAGQRRRPRTAGRRPRRGRCCTAAAR